MISLISGFSILSKLKGLTPCKTNVNIKFLLKLLKIYIRLH